MCFINGYIRKTHWSKYNMCIYINKTSEISIKRINRNALDIVYMPPKMSKFISINRLIEN